MKNQPLFDRMSPPTQVVFLAVFVLLVPIWFPLWVIMQIRSGK